MSDPETYELFAVRYAHLATRLRRDNFIAAVDPHDGVMPIDYYVWAIVNESRAIVVDTGFGREEAKKRGRDLIRLPAEGLEMLGIAAADVEDVIVPTSITTTPGRSAPFPGRASTCRTWRCPTPRGARCATRRSATPIPSTTWSTSCAASMGAESSSMTATAKSRRASPCTTSVATPWACNACACAPSAAGWCWPPTPVTSTRNMEAVAPFSHRLQLGRHARRLREVTGLVLDARAHRSRPRPPGHGALSGARGGARGRDRAPRRGAPVRPTHARR